MEPIKTWIKANQSMLQVLGSSSVLLLVVTVLALPVVVHYLPSNYFVAHRRQAACPRGRSSFKHSVIIAAKNFVGVIIVLVGLALLVLPGQGVITILVGITLTNFPGKYALERKIASQPAVHHTLNWMRTKLGKPPFDIS